MAFKFIKSAIPEVLFVEPKIYNDERGYFFETFKYTEFLAQGVSRKFVQTNYSRSKRGVLRGLHYQCYPKAQAKLVQVVIGEIFDVAVDIRRSSPTYGKWVSEILSAENRRMLYIPEGFAHGFCVLSEEVEMLYCCSEEYAPDFEGGVIWNDPALNITWPIKDPIVSERDQKFKTLANARHNFEYYEK